MPYLSTVRGRTFGFVPANETAQRISRFRVGSGAAAIYPGDVVQMLAAGTVATITANAATQIVGVAAAYNAASTANTSFPVYYGGAGARFYVSDNEATTGQLLAATSIGANIEIVCTTGDTTLLRSKQVLAATSAQQSATSPCHLVSLADIEADTFSASTGTTTNSRTWVVEFNNYAFAPNTAGV
jgi:hypothetical protein